MEASPTTAAVVSSWAVCCESVCHSGDFTLSARANSGVSSIRIRM